MAQTRDRHGAVARPYTRHIRQLLALISPWKSISYPDFFRPPALTRSFTDTCTAPEAGVRAGSLTALFPHSNRSRYHSTWSLPRSCCTDPGGSCSQPAPISLLCAGNTNPCSAPGAAAKAWQWHRSLFGEPRRVWIPAQDGFGTDGQRTNRFPATWNRWKETIAGGKENNQNQGHVLSLPISAPA